MTLPVPDQATFTTLACPSAEKPFLKAMLPMASVFGRRATGLGVRELAEAAGVSPNTVARLERGEELRPATLATIRAALEAAGVDFIEESGGGLGVRLRKGAING